MIPLADVNIEVGIDSRAARKELADLAKEFEKIPSGASSGFKKWLSDNYDKYKVYPVGNKLYRAGAKGVADATELNNPARKMLRSVWYEEEKERISEKYGKKVLAFQQSQQRKENAIRLQGNLSMMFAGMMVQRTMEGLLKPAEDLAGVFDIMNSILTLLFLPVVIYVLLPALLLLLNVVNALPEPIKLVVGAIVLLLGALGMAAAFLGQMGMAGAGFNMVFGAGAAAATGVAAKTAVDGVGAGIVDVLGTAATVLTANAAGVAGKTGLGLLGLAGTASAPVMDGLPSKDIFGNWHDAYGNPMTPEQANESINNRNTWNSMITVTNNFNSSTAPNTHSGYASSNGMGIHIPTGVG